MESQFLAALIVCLVLSMEISFSEADCANPSKAKPEKNNSKNLINDATQFGLDVYKSLAEKPGNFVFSPISISFALAMTSLGAKGNTLKEMLATLKIDSYDELDVHWQFQQLKYSLLKEEAIKDYSLFFTCDLFGEKSYNFDEHFMGKAATYYTALLKPLDFKGNPETSRTYINDWVSIFTKGKIKDLLAPKTVDAQTKLVLVNAIYFKGDWLSKFSKSKTLTCEFRVTENGYIVEADLMHNTLNVNHGYSEDLKSQVLELPYKGEHLSMVIILPDLQKMSINKVEQALTPEILSSFQLNRGDCEVWLPKFKLESSFNLNDKLQQLGMKDLFQAGAADLSGISASNDLYVSSVVHKAFIEVNEGGTEAAVEVVDSVALNPVFKADHPFIFYIKDNSMNSIIFLGRVEKPSDRLIKK